LVVIITEAPNRRLLTHDGGLPSGNYPRADLVEYTRSDLIPAMIAEAVAKEREACLQLARESETLYASDRLPAMAKASRRVALAIRARGQS
jgi:hypothetical protein